MGEPSYKEPKIDICKGSKTSTNRQPETHNDHTVTTSPGTVRKKHRLGDDRICRVCGDKAVAHNFDVISCESCKTFFRRNAHKTQKECAFEGNCEITVQTRRFCPPCRLKKSFSVGMRADMILDEVERQARMEKILTNRKKRQEAAKKDNSDSTQDGSTDPCNGEPNPHAVCFPDSCNEAGLNFDDNNTDPVDILLSELEQHETQQQELTTSQSIGQLSSHCPHLNRTRTVSTASSEGTPTTTENSPNNTVDQTNDSRTRSAIFQHVPPSLLPSDPMMYWRLTSEEHKLITDLTVAYKETLLKLPVSEDALTIQLEALSLEQTLGYCDGFALEIINFLKRVPDFKTLDIQDQQAVLKANAMVFLMLKSSAYFSEEKDAWLKPFGALPVDVFARMTKNEVVVKRYADFCRSLKRILKNDFSGYVLVNCWLLFEPQAPNVLDRQKVNVLKDSS
ncbi:vitamin D3 receptor B-like isoform X2 [Littorina saxatilis]|uniref:vitamin D3 receptor B-like isoform X2 n=1 Tax=Littorina saxatilis TaxID=31220 RepID=UPI0038B58111